MDYESTRGHEGGSASESLNLVSEIGAAAAAATRSGGIPLLPNAENVVVLPAGAALDDIVVRGRDLVIELPDGRVFVVPDGAVFVPVIVIDGVAVPPLNLAAYLIGEEPQPAAGAPQSSGGNFADAADPIQPAYGLGDLLPYTELNFEPLANEEVLPGLINNTPAITSVPRVGEGTEVSEAGLAANTATRANESPGSAFDGSPVTTAGVITFTSLDGVGSIVINGVVLNPGAFPQTVLSDSTGTLVVTGVSFDPATGNGSISYSYTLTDNTSATAGSQVSVPIVVIDQDGDSANDTLVISIIDDAPTAFPNTNTVTEGATVGGNVLVDQTDDIFGADGAAPTTPGGGVVGVRAANGDTTTAVTSGTGTQIQGQFGTLTLNADGTYTYQAKANITNQDVQDVFVYTIRDGDGDQSTSTLTITIDDVSGSLSDNDAIVDESGLDGIGSQIVPDGEFFTGGQISVSGVSGPLTFTLTSPANGAYGNLVLNSATGAYSYTLDTPFDEPTSNNGRDTINDADNFTYQVTDQNGNIIGTGTIAVDIVDDVPAASADFNTVAEGGSVSGNVLPNDIFGADGPAATSPGGGVIGVRAAGGDLTTAVTSGTGSQIQGQHGTLTLNADGSYTYAAGPNVPSSGVVDVFVYTIEDGDGDRSTTTLTITVRDIVATITDNDAIVDESGLDGIGSQIVPNGEFFTGGQISVSGATGPFTFTLTSPANGAFGNLVLNSATGAYSYTLDTPVDGPTSNNGRNTINGAESFGYEVRDQNGNLLGSGSIVVDIVDDVPTAFANTNTVSEGNSVSGNVLIDATDDIFGADGPTLTSPAGGVIGVRAANGDTTTEVTTGTGNQIQGLHGTLILDASGTYTYVSAADSISADAVDVFVYTIEDGDGDRSTTTLTINISDNPPPNNPVLISGLTPLVNGGDASVDEDDLINPEGSDQSQSTTVTGSFFISAPDGVDDLTVGTIAVIVNGVFQGPALATGVTPLGNTLTFTNYNAANGEVFYSYTLNDNEDHAAPQAPDVSDENFLFESFGVSLSDVNGDTDTDTLVVRIVDDVPTANNDGTYNVEAGVAYQIADALGNDVYGADGVDIADPAAVFIVDAPGKGTASYSNGVFTYTADQNASGADSFTYRIIDGDGDESTATIAVNITADSAPSGGTAFAVVDDDGLKGAPDDGAPAPGNPASTVDDVADADADNDNDETTFAGTLNFSKGGDVPVTVGFATVTGDTDQVGTETVEYTVAGNVLLATVSTGPRTGTELFRVTITDTAEGDYKVELLANVLHDSRDGETDDDTENATDPIVTIAFNVEDSDGSPSLSPVLLQITFDDDAPTANDDGTYNVEAGVAYQIANALSNDAFGADGVDITDSTAVAIVATPGKGTASYSNGVFTYTANQDASGLDSFTYKIVDGDGDESTATITVNITADSEPSGGRAFAAVDDDGLTGPPAGNPDDPASDLDANAGDDPGDTSEASFTGTLGYVFGGDGQHASEPLVFADGTGQLGGEQISYSWDSGTNTLTAEITSGPRTGLDLFKVEVTDVASGAYTVTLLRNVLHDPGNEENDADITLAYTVKDGDGSTDDGSLKITFDDDVPTADDDANAVTEGAGNSTQGNVYGPGGNTAPSGGDDPDVIGADGAAAAGPVTGARAGELTDPTPDPLTPIDADGEDITGTYGTLNLRSDGSYTYTLTAVSVPGGASETFTYQIEDGDGDTALAQLIITINQDRNVPLLTGDAKSVDEEGLPGGTSEEADAIPSNDDSEIVTGSFTIDANGEGYTLTLTADNANTLGDPVANDTLATSKGVLRITSVSAPDLNGVITYNYEYTLSAALDHVGQGEVNPILDTITIDATDATGDGALQATIDISIIDDVPVLGTFTSDTVPNDPNATGTGTFPYFAGADGHDFFTIVGPALPGISYTTVQNANGALLTAKSAADVTIFTLQVNTNGTYEFTLVTPDAGSTTTIPLNTIPPGNDPSFAETSDFRVEFYSPDGINSSTPGFGVDNQYVRNGEFFEIEFHSTGTAGDQAPTVDPEFYNSATLTVNDINKSVEVDITVYNDILGTSELVQDNYLLPDKGAPLVIPIDPTVLSEFNRIEVRAVGGDAQTGQGARFITLSVTKTILPQDVTLNFDISATDQDGDTTAVQTLTIDVDATPPVVLDLDGDGVEFVPLAAGVAYDYNGDGVMQSTAWAGADDGILVHDIDGDGLVKHAAEFVFGNASLTDLQALAARYGDTLDASDADFASFGVWRDANLNGVTDAGEFRSLTELGIVSISLKSDGVSYSAANGDVLVHGQTSYARADGSTGVAADASFAVGSERIAARSMEIATTAIAAGVLASALVDETQAAPDDGLTLVSSSSSSEGVVTPESLYAPAEVESTSEALPPDDVGEDSSTPLAGSGSYGDEADADAPADLGEVVDHGGSGDPDSGSQSAETPGDGQDSLFADAGSGSDIMQGLLLLADAPQAAGPASPADGDSDGLGALQDALADAQSEDFVDSLVNQLASEPAPASDDAGQIDLAGLLAADVGAEHGVMPNAFDFTQAVDEAQLVAAA